ncbi:hypothetical protein AOLI_G00133480 [Acnodon oligacanthus]
MSGGLPYLRQIEECGGTLERVREQPGAGREQHTARVRHGAQHVAASARPAQHAAALQHSDGEQLAWRGGQAGGGRVGAAREPAASFIPAPSEVIRTSAAVSPASGTFNLTTTIPYPTTPNFSLSTCCRCTKLEKALKTWRKALLA